MPDINSLVEALKKGEWKKRLDVANQLVEMNSSDVVPILIPFLDSEDIMLRDASAMALMDIRDDSAVKPIMNAIYKKGGDPDRGLLVYSLTTLDCAIYLEAIFDLALDDDPFVRKCAVAIMEDQTFWISMESIKKCEKWLNETKGKTEHFQFLKDYLEDLSRQLPELFIHKGCNTTNRTLKKRWEKKNQKNWAEDPDTGKSQDGSHEDALNDGGVDHESNFEPRTAIDHRQRHKERGDFKRWKKRRDNKGSGSK